MAKISAADTAKRKAFAEKLWTKDPKLSIPKMNAAIKKEFKGMVNTQNLYSWRKDFWKSHGMTGAEDLQKAQDQQLKGRPELPTRRESSRDVFLTGNASQIMAAARPPQTMTENSFETTTFRIHSEQDGALLQKCFDYLNRIGFTDIKVVEYTPNFAIFSR